MPLGKPIAFHPAEAPVDYTKRTWWFIKVMHDVEYTTAHGAWGCLHIGTMAIFILPRRGNSSHWRLEICTPLHRWRWGRGVY